ncbi:MAG: hypothetical protein AB7S65_12695 [Sulfuricurvum sp.]
MSRFVFSLWGRWLILFVLLAVALAGGWATVATLVSYAIKGAVALDAQTIEALKTIWLFWLEIGYGVGMIGGLVGALGLTYRRCIAGFTVVPLNCKGEILERLPLKGYLRLWRKWFFTLIWVNAAQIILLTMIHKMLFGGTLWLGWFTPLWLTPLIAIAALPTFWIWFSRCKRIRLEPCG